jgi:hypothetical protein
MRTGEEDQGVQGPRPMKKPPMMIPAIAAHTRDNTTMPRGAKGDLYFAFLTGYRSLHWL